MALLCAECASANTSTGLGDHVSCGNCGAHGPHKHAGEPSLHGDSFPEPDEGLAVDDTAGEVTVEATPEGDDE